MPKKSKVELEIRHPRVECEFVHTEYLVRPLQYIYKITFDFCL